jgi:hypothetical protein
MLSVLQQQLARAHGLAIAASAVVVRVEERVEDQELRFALLELRREAEELRGRCLEVERGFGDELAEELLAQANSTSERGSDLAGAWFKAGTDALEAWIFLAMGEAAEVAVWTALDRLSERAGAGFEAVRELAAWALPVQQRHLATALEGAEKLGLALPPGAGRWG